MSLSKTSTFMVFFQVGFVEVGRNNFSGDLRVVLVFVYHVHLPAKHGCLSGYTLLIVLKTHMGIMVALAIYGIICRGKSVCRGKK